MYFRRLVRTMPNGLAIITSAASIGKVGCHALRRAGSRCR
jgi:hypothetical protein